MTDALDTLDGFADRAWALLAEGVQTRAHVQLATVSPDGWPEVRTVVLRGADRAMGTLVIYTDLQSDKVTSLQASPRAGVHLWHPDAAIQIRATCDVTILTGPDTDTAWAAVPDHARQSYGVVPPPGTVIPTAMAYEKPCAQAQFAILQCAIKALDVVSLALPHRRARFQSQGGDWIANWLAP